MDSPVSCLSPELLSNVFLQMVDRWSPDYSWISVMLVCRYWHDVALACPSLWSNIGPYEAQTVDHLLRLSKLTPLLVEIVTKTRSPGHLSWPITALLEGDSTRRMWNLSLTYTGDNVDDPIPNLILGGTPRVEVLEIEMRGISDPLDLKQWLNRINLPSLTRLTLTHCQPDWNSSIFSGLSTLSLTHCGLSNLEQPTRQQLHHILKQCGGLESFYLLGVEPNRSNDHDLVRDIATLPRLKRLFLTMSQAPMRSLFRSTRLPDRLHWDITTDAIVDEMRDICIPNIQSHEELACCVSSITLSNLRLNVDIDTYYANDLRRPRSGRLNVRCDKFPHLEDAMRIIDTGNWAAIVSLNMSVFIMRHEVCVEDEESWYTFLGSLPHLEKLTMATPLGDKAVESLILGLLKSLTPRRRSTGSEPESNSQAPRILMCSHLAELNFRSESAIRQILRAQTGVDNGDGGESSWDTFLGCFRERSQGGAPLRLLRIRWDDNYCFPEDSVNILQVLVGTVDIDRYKPIRITNRSISADGGESVVLNIPD